MANYTGWAYLFTFLGFAIICVAMARDSWTETIRNIGTWPQDVNGELFLSLNTRREFVERPKPGPSKEVTGDLFPTYFKSFGTVWYQQGFSYGYSYKLPCPGDESKSINAQHYGLIATLLMANINGFIASIVAIFAATRSTITQSYIQPRNLSFSAFISAVASWALWLGTHDEISDDSSAKCHWKGFTQLAPEINVDSKDRELGASWGLMLASSVLYLIFFIWLHFFMVKQERPSHGRKTTVFLALAAYGFCFCASTYNVWTSSDLTNIADKYENVTRGQNVVGTQYGLGFAAIYADTYYAYSDRDYIPLICPIQDADFDGAFEAIRQSGRIVLGFGISAIVLGAVALYLQAIRHRKTMFFSLASFIAIAVCLIVWGTADSLIRERCCDATQCQLGTSYGLAAISAGFFFAAVAYNGWVMSDDVYVMHSPEEYGMAKY